MNESVGIKKGMGHHKMTSKQTKVYYTFSVSSWQAEPVWQSVKAIVIALWWRLIVTVLLINKLAIMPWNVSWLSLARHETSFYKSHVSR